MISIFFSIIPILYTFLQPSFGQWQVTDVMRMVSMTSDAPGDISQRAPPLELRAAGDGVYTDIYIYMYVYIYICLYMHILGRLPRKKHSGTTLL